MKSAESLLPRAGAPGITLRLLLVIVPEIVWVREKVYRMKRRGVRGLSEADMNTPQRYIILSISPSRYQVESLDHNEG